MKGKRDGWLVIRAMCFAVMLFSITAGEALAASYYSSPSGSGTSCLSASPCSLATGVGKLAAGDTLLLGDGIYYGGITVGASGTGVSPVTIKAVNDGGAIVDGQGTTRPLYISGKSYINVEGIVFRNSIYDVVDVSGGASYINLRRLSAYNSGVGNYHLFLIYNSNHVLVEDCAASQTKGTNKAGRYCFVSFAGAHDNTFRRNYCKYYSHTGGGGPCAAGADYGGSYDLWENNVFDVSEMPAGCSNVNYQFAIFGEGLYNDTSHNQWYGNVAIGGPNTVKAAYAESDGTISVSNWELVNNVFIDGQAGIVNIGAAKGAGWVVQNNTVIAIPSNSMTQTNGSGAAATASSNSYLTGSLGLSAVNGSSITSKYNNFSSINTLYSSNVLGKTGDKTVSPFYDTTTYGYGAYLMVPQPLQGQGENGSDIGAEVLYQSNDGVVTGAPLWPWPMENRIFAETGVSVTYDANGGLWKTLNGVYSASSVTADTIAPSTPTGLSVSVASSSQINLAWIASTDNAGVAGYKIYKNGTQIATTTATTYSNTALTASTTYTYTVSAYDAAGNNSAQSAPASATTLSSASAPQVTLSATQAAPGATVTVQVSGGNCGVQEWVGLYLASNPDSAYSVNGTWQYLNGLQTPPTTGLCSATLKFVVPTASGVYNFRYFAQNGYATRLAVSPNVTVAASDTTAPSIPAGLTAKGVSSSQINLSWTASTDNVGVTGYKVYRNGALIATTTATTYSNTALTASTTYSYTVSAYDAAGNNSPQSAPISVTTLAGTTASSITIIVDNGQAGTSQSGSWYVSSMSYPYGSSSLYAYISGTAGTAPTYTWSAALPTSGTYDVYAWWTSNTNRSTAAPYTIAYGGGSQTVAVNQQINGGQWNKLGTFTFANSGKVTLTASSGNGLVVSGDAIKFVSR